MVGVLKIQMCMPVSEVMNNKIYEVEWQKQVAANQRKLAKISLGSRGGCGV